MKQKTVTDYAGEVAKYYPDIPLSDIKKILNYGWKHFYLYNSFGSDILTVRDNFWMYCGTINKNSLRHYNYYRIKLSNKIRLYDREMKGLWDGYYYFALSRRQYDNYLALMNKRGRKRKTFTFKDVFLYKLKDDCLTRQIASVALFKYPLTLLKGYKFYLPNLVTDKAELVDIHNPLKFEDLIKINEKYKFLCK